MAYYRSVAWDEAKARELWDAGCSVADIAKAVGTTPGAVEGRAYRQGWPLRMPQRSAPKRRVAGSVSPKCIKPPANGKPWTIQCDACGSKYLIGTTEDCHVKAAHIGASVLRCPHCGRKADSYEAQPWVA